MSEPPQQELGPGPNSDEFDPKQHVWDGQDWWTSDRRYWWDGARWQPRDAPHVSGLAAMLGAPSPSASLEVNPAHRRDFWIGYAGWIVVNAVAVFLTATALDPDARAGASGVLLLINLAALIATAIVRRYVAMGIALAFASAFALTVIEGVFFTVSDFAGGLYDPGVMAGFLIVGGILFAIGAFFALRAVHRGIR